MVQRMTVVDRTTVIPSPPDVVFAAVMSPDTAPLIDPGVREWRPDTEPIGVGTRFSIRGRLGALPIRGTSVGVQVIHRVLGRRSSNPPSRRSSNPPL